MQNLSAAVDAIRKRTKLIPEVGIILGTGLGGLVEEANINVSIDYQDIPHFPTSTVESHHGKLLFGTINGKYVVIMQGRFHYYEGYSMQQVTLPVRVMKLLGIRHLLISNAAGGLNHNFQISDLMLIGDHINLLPQNPLVGAHYPEFGPMFPDMSEPYDEAMMQKAQDIAPSLGCNCHKGVYAAVSGPNLETRAEYRYLQLIGADAVGMSTVPEVIVARQMDVPVFATSVITDVCFPDALEKVVVEKILAAAERAEPHLTQLFYELINAL